MATINLHRDEMRFSCPNFEYQPVTVLISNPNPEKTFKLTSKNGNNQIVFEPNSIFSTTLNNFNNIFGFNIRMTFPNIEQFTCRDLDDRFLENPLIPQAFSPVKKHEDCPNEWFKFSACPHKFFAFEISKDCNDSKELSKLDYENMPINFKKSVAIFNDQETRRPQEQEITKALQLYTLFNLQKQDITKAIEFYKLFKSKETEVPEAIKFYEQYKSDEKSIPKALELYNRFKFQIKEIPKALEFYNRFRSLQVKPSNLLDDTQNHLNKLSQLIKDMEDRK